MKLQTLALRLMLCASPLTALAHEGHGLPGAHWHATDTLGFVALGVGVAVAIWLGKGGK